jgi:hypothetical protein
MEDLKSIHEKAVGGSELRVAYLSRISEESPDVVACTVSFVFGTPHRLRSWKIRKVSKLPAVGANPAVNFL